MYLRYKRVKKMKNNLFFMYNKEYLIRNEIRNFFLQKEKCFNIYCRCHSLISNAAEKGIFLNIFAGNGSEERFTKYHKRVVNNESPSIKCNYSDSFQIMLNGACLGGDFAKSIF